MILVAMSSTGSWLAVELPLGGKVDGEDVMTRDVVIYVQ